MKKANSLLLAVLMFVTLLPVGVWAEEEPKEAPVTVTEEKAEEAPASASEPEPAPEPVEPEPEKEPEAPAAESAEALQVPEVPAEQEPAPETEEPAEPKPAEPEEERPAEPNEPAEELPAEQTGLPEEPSEPAETEYPWEDLDDEAFIAFILAEDNAAYLTALLSDTETEEYIAFMARVETIEEETDRKTVETYLLSLLSDETEPAEETPESPEEKVPETEEPSAESAEPVPAEPAEPEPFAASVPSSVTLSAGAASIRTTVTGEYTGTLAYQWQRLDDSVDYELEIDRREAWTDIPGETSAVLAFTDIDEETFAPYGSMLFRCVVRSEDDTAISGETKLLAVFEVMEEPVPDSETLLQETEENGEDIAEDLTEDIPENVLTAEAFLSSLTGESALEGEWVLTEDTILSTEAEGTLSAVLIIPSGVTLIVEGTITVLSTVTVKGAITIAESGSLTVAEGAGLSFEGTESELMNFGTVSVYGALMLSEETTFADTNLPIRVCGEGTVIGTDRIGFVPDTEETDEITAEDLEAAVSAGVWDREGVTRLMEDAVLPLNGVLRICAGTLIVPEGVCLTNGGLLVIEGGELITEGTLRNDFYMVVSGDGILTVNGSFETDDRSALVWDQTEGNPLVSGIRTGLMDCSVLAGSVKEFRQAVKTDGYRTLTVYIPDASFVEGVTIPDGVAVSVR